MGARASVEDQKGHGVFLMELVAARIREGVEGGVATTVVDSEGLGEEQAQGHVSFMREPEFRYRLNKRVEVMDGHLVRDFGRSGPAVCRIHRPIYRPAMSETLIAIFSYLKDRRYEVEYIDKQEVQEHRAAGGTVVFHTAGKVTKHVEVHFYGLVALIESVDHILVVKNMHLLGDAEKIDVHDPDSFQHIAKRIDKIIDERAHDMARWDYMAQCDG